MSKGVKWMSYVFLLPATLYMLLFVGYPIVSNFLLSFQDLNVMTFAQETTPWVGLGTYEKLLSDPTLLVAITNTFLFTIVSITIQFVLGFALALFFNRSFPGAKNFRGLLVIAWMLPVTITAITFKYMLSPADGIINYFLHSLRLTDQPIGWLIDPKLALGSIIAANVWIGTPFNMILLATALSTVPPQLYESAKVDGASAWTTFRVITLPYLRSAILSVLVLGFIYTFRVFELIYMMTNGGPVNSTEVLSTVSYRLSFGEFNFSAGAAAANILFAVLFVVSLMYLNLIKKEETL